jgi:hypothetical protein
MIKTRNINGKPEETPKGNFAVHSDSEFFYFFETEAEREQYFKENRIEWTSMNF